MNRSLVLLVLPLLLVAVPPGSASVEVTEVGKQPVEAGFPSGGLLNLDLCASEAEVRGATGNQVRITYDGSSDTLRVRVRIKASGKSGEVEIDNCPHNNFRIGIEVPRSTDLHLRMAAGELTVKGVTGSKDLEMHAGEMSVEVGKKEDYAHVDGSVMTGEVDAGLFQVSKGGLFRSFEWAGPGKHRLHAHVGAGQLTLN